MAVMTILGPVRPTTGLLLRLTGGALLGLAWLCADWLARIMPPGIAEPVPTFALILALLMFVAATGGTSLLLLGGHILDPVRVSTRWARSAD
ncbi:hypothetical protein [Sphingobium algorifonticola]|uniref:Uncharacterized protein n=1 Tax=Sphingobium algorifonticola TaxID=2008318 RepID=A0A437J5F4_9SPHN|nr:hypothetical protein [Sphingobium algorifonticola]RVT40179.1 hypothetical protein ENE74_12590 [Sphingobium algorifonticola]